MPMIRVEDYNGKEFRLNTQTIAAVHEARPTKYRGAVTQIYISGAPALVSTYTPIQRILRRIKRAETGGDDD